LIGQQKWGHAKTTPNHLSETTEAMVNNIDRELAEIEQAIGRCRGDRVAELHPALPGACTYSQLRRPNSEGQ
jgi:hypothetical protein